MASTQFSIESPLKTAGFLVFVSPYASYHSNIGITVDGISVDSHTSNVTIHAQFTAVGDSNDTFVLAFQVPYDYTDLNAQGTMSFWSNGVQLAGGAVWNNTFRSSPYDSEERTRFIYLVTNRSIGNVLFNTFDFTVKFRWISSIFRLSYSSSGIIVPFALH